MNVAVARTEGSEPTASIRHAPVPGPLAAIAEVYAAMTRSAGDAVAVFSSVKEGPNSQKRFRTYSSWAWRMVVVQSGARGGGGGDLGEPV